MLQESKGSQGSRWVVVIAAGLAVLMAALDLSITNIALPTLGHTFVVPPSRVQWVILAYSLPAVALLLPLGKWVDLTDRRAAFLLAVGGFGAASIACGLAPSLAWLIAARFAQGCFGALITTLVFPIVVAAVPPERRGRALGVVGALGPLGAVLGPGLGGMLLGTLGWRSIFFVNAPVCLLALLVAARSLAPSGHLSAPRWSWVAQAGLLGGAMLGLLLALTEASTTRPAYVALVALLAVAALALLAWLRLPESRPVRTLLARPQAATSVGTLAAFATVGGLLNYVPPFFLEDGLHASPQVVGLTIISRALVMGAVAPLGGYAADRWGSRRMSVFAAIVVLGGLLLLAPLSPAWSLPDVAWRLGVLGLGLGLFTGPNQSALMRATPHQLMGTASGLAGLGRNLGFALGPALATILWTAGGAGVGGLRAAMLAAVALAGAGALTCVLGPASAESRSPLATNLASPTVRETT